MRKSYRKEKEAMKKIYFIDESLDKMGGVEKMISLLSNLWVHDYEVHLISLFNENEKPFFTFNSKVKYTKIIDKYRLSKRKKRSKTQEFLYTLKYWDLVEKEKSAFLEKHFSMITEKDIVIFGRVSAAQIVLPYLPKVGKVIVRAATSLYDTNYQDQILELFQNRVDYVVTLNNKNKRLFEEFFEGKVNVVRIVNPLSLEITQEPDLSVERVITTGRYNLQKGFDVLIKAWKKVNEMYPFWDLDIIGEGDYEDEFRKMIRENHLSQKIFLKKPSKHIEDELAKASIFVMPSRFEGYCNSLVEAMAFGLPCISFNWECGAEDHINSYENGILVPLEDPIKYMDIFYVDDKDVDHLAKAIIELIENPKLREKLGKNARKIREDRTLEIIKQEWEKLF